MGSQGPFCDRAHMLVTRFAQVSSHSCYAPLGGSRRESPHTGAQDGAGPSRTKDRPCMPLLGVHEEGVKEDQLEMHRTRWPFTSQPNAVAHAILAHQRPPANVGIRHRVGGATGAGGARILSCGASSPAQPDWQASTPPARSPTGEHGDCGSDRRTGGSKLERSAEPGAEPRRKTRGVDPTPLPCKLFFPDFIAVDLYGVRMIW